MDEKGECYPTQDQIAEILGVMRPTANKRIKKLLEFRYNGSPIITREKKRVIGSNMCDYSVYKILPKSGFGLFNSSNVTSSNVPNVTSNTPSNVTSNTDSNVASTLHKQEPYNKNQYNQNYNNKIIITAKNVIDYFCKRYFETYGVGYNPNFRREGPMIKNKLIKNYDPETIEKIIDTVFEEYEGRWKKPKYPRPTIGALVSWLANEALSIAGEKSKEREEDQNDSRLSKNYIEKVLKKLGE